MIVFVGSNPSISMKSKTPFQGAKSEGVLVQWITALGIKSYKVLNVSDNANPAGSLIALAKASANDPDFLHDRLRKYKEYIDDFQ